MAREITTHAAAAKQIRTILKAEFPQTTFTVRARSYSGGDSVDVHWTDGPTTEQIDRLTGEYEYGHFDGSDDMYHYSNRRDDLPQVRFVQTQRDMSDETRRSVVAFLNARYGWSLALVERTSGNSRWLDVADGSDAPMDNGWGWRSHEIHRTFARYSAVCEACGHHVRVADAFCAECGARIQDDEQAA